MVSFVQILNCCTLNLKRCISQLWCQQWFKSMLLQILPNFCQDVFFVLFFFFKKCKLVSYSRLLAVLSQVCAILPKHITDSLYSHGLLASDMSSTCVQSVIKTELRHIRAIPFIISELYRILAVGTGSPQTFKAGLPAL